MAAGETHRRQHVSITPGSTLYYLILFLIFGNLFAFLIGVLMIAAPQRLGDLFKISNRWVSTRRPTALHRCRDVPVTGRRPRHSPRR